LTLTQKRRLYTAIAAAALLLVCTAIAGIASAQTFNPQQPPDFGNFNGTRPDFGGNPPDFNGSQGFPFGGDFNGTFPGRGDGNFTRPSGAPNQYDANNSQNPQAVGESKPDYTLIIMAVIAVVAVVAVALTVLTRKKKTDKSVSPQPPVQENFDF
jgi:hypothetical protein